MQTTPSQDVQRGNHDDPEYDMFIARMQARFERNTQSGKIPVFTTDAIGLWETYLEALPADQRQFHNCHCCRRFIETYGGLVTVDDNGRTVPAIWNADDAPERYAAAVDALYRHVSNGYIETAFHAKETVWGQRETGIWHHFALTPPAPMHFNSMVKTSHQMMAERREDFKNIQVALDAFPIEHTAVALRLLRSESMHRSEAALGQAEWLHKLHEDRKSVNGTRFKKNITWRAVAMAPAGFCHPRTSMVGTLLEDIATGMDYEQISGRWQAKMHPLQYQRPQAPPTSGALAAAEKLVEQMGIAPSLERRFCRLDEVESIWLPTPAKPVRQAEGGVFGHIKPKGEIATRDTIQLPTKTMTWDKFKRMVLSTAERIEYRVPGSAMSYGALVTAANPDAPPILQWDNPENRNPVSWYLWHGGSTPESFGLDRHAYVPVEAITAMPCHWKDSAHTHHPAGLVLILAGAAETRMSGNALFPSCLRSELHGVRSVIEAYSKTATISGEHSPHAAGLIVQSTLVEMFILRVTVAGECSEYKIDRWD